MSLKSFLQKEWLFCLSLSIFVILSLAFRRLPNFSTDEFEVLFLLLVLFVTIQGLQESALLQRIALWFEQGKFIVLKLVGGTFLLSMFVTNDVALIVMVPLTLLMDIEYKDWIVILEALSANAAALFPYSNPQNLYIYWHYHLQLAEFIRTIAPFVFSFLLLVLGASLFINTSAKAKNIQIAIKKEARYFIAFFILIILTILKVVPLFVGGVVLLYALFLYPQALKIDYFLLVTFFLFFGISDHIQYAFAQELANPRSVFLSSLLLSQLISNVPATLVMANFTSHWQALLWGVNVGGYGLFWGSLANLIALKLYIRSFHDLSFVVKFLIANFLALGVGISLYTFMAS